MGGEPVIVTDLLELYYSSLYKDDQINGKTSEMVKKYSNYVLSINACLPGSFRELKKYIFLTTFV